MHKFLTRALSALAVGLVFSACQDATEPVALEGSGGSGNTTECVGALTGTFDNVEVPPDAECTLTNSIVRGWVKARQDSRLFMFNNDVGGNIEGHKAMAVQVLLNTVGGNIHIREAGDLEVLSAVVLLSVVDGNIHIHKGRFPFGDWAVQASEVTKGNIHVEHNGTIFGSGLLDNIVDGNVHVFHNFGGGEKFVVFNTIDGNLHCRHNDPPFASLGNVVTGQTQGQCEGAEALTGSASVAARVDLSEFPVRRQAN